MGENFEIKLMDVSLEELRIVFGIDDVNIKIIQKYFDVLITYRGDSVFLNNGNSQSSYIKIKDILNTLVILSKNGYEITPRTVSQAISLVNKGELNILEDFHKIVLGKNLSNKVIFPKSLGQLWYAKALLNFDIVFSIGPAGTGKTYMAVVYAVSLLKTGKIKKIILTRPAVEAGESLGFLPGDLKEKADPYLRPLYDALYEMLGKENVEKLIEKGTIEIAPLAYMRGRTLEDAFIILDEGQNTTSSQLKMFLTRMGFRSKMVITGDVTQVDLPIRIKSGLGEAEEILGKIKDIAFVKLSASDVTRHPLVQEIIDAYEK
ncbi:MAG: PhoH family protein [Bacilli bacterium]|nr:PhoH family protein [Bacilli bacterium]